MYLNDGAQITNTPSGIKAAYNTLTFVPGSDAGAYYHVPRPYTDSTGHTRYWNSWNSPALVHLPGGTYSSTPTSTGAYYYRNTVTADELAGRRTTPRRPMDNSLERSSDVPAPLK